MAISDILNIISVAWFSNLLVSFYVNRAVKKKLPIRKPFGCEKCMGFWWGAIFFSIQMQPIETIFIFACITSLTAALLMSILNKLNQ